MEQNTVHITKFTFSSLISELDIDEIMKNLTNKIVFESAPVEFLYKPNIETILSLKFVLEKPDRMLEYYKKSKISNKNLFLVKLSNPKYHFDSSCERLNNRFENMRIPEQIVKKGDKIIDEFREYLLKEYGKFTPSRYKQLEDLILTNVNLKFGVNLVRNDIKILELDNSGLENIRNLSLSALENKILNFSEEYSNLIKKYPDIFPTYTLKAFLVKKPDNIKFYPPNYYNTNRKAEFCNILEDFYEKVQIPTYKCLIQYYMVYFNPELRFEGNLLNQLGLAPCSKCILNDSEPVI